MHPTDVDLTGADLSHANLSQADLSGANLTDADLTGTNLARARLFRADLSRANLVKGEAGHGELRRLHPVASGARATSSAVSDRTTSAARSGSWRDIEFDHIR
ncbi:pentapeptide repeat-containing protein [Nocardia wallacei]|uniref:pentapeptide repeat-containing protein n=1 Tax=Nocardia wallacei TaxID=480035 RepID=UPI002454F76F|nr:pentapeptide repeat-containing protein [Nocardia wallacei]